jgi:hypothetical protein
MDCVENIFLIKNKVVTEKKLIVIIIQLHLMCYMQVSLQKEFDSKPLATSPSFI